MIDQKAQNFADKAAKRMGGAVQEILYDSMSTAWNLGASYYAQDLALLKTIKANINNPGLSDAEFRAFVRRSCGND